MRIRVTIDFEDEGFSASSYDVPGIILLAQGETVEEVKRDMTEVIDEFVADESSPEVLRNESYSVEWAFSVASFLNKYSSILTQSGLAKLAGINPNQLNSYKKGLKKPRKEQVQKLQQAVNEFAKDLLSTPLMA